MVIDLNLSDVFAFVRQIMKELHVYLDVILSNIHETLIKEKIDKFYQSRLPLSFLQIVNHSYNSMAHQTAICSRRVVNNLQKLSFFKFRYISNDLA